MLPVGGAQIGQSYPSQLSPLGLLVALDKVLCPGDKAEANLTAGRRRARQRERRQDDHAGCLICAGESRIRASTSKENRRLHNTPEDLPETCKDTASGRHIRLSEGGRRARRVRKEELRSNGWSGGCRQSPHVRAGWRRGG